MSSPVTSDEFKAVSADPSDPLCNNFLDTLLKFPVLFYKWFSSAVDASGAYTNAFKKDANWLKAGDLIFSASGLAADSTRLLCDGSAVNRNTYADLYAAILSLHGPGDGVTTFNLPDYRNFFPVGAGALYAIAASGGAASHTLTLPQLPAHQHGPDTTVNATGFLVGASSGATFAGVAGSPNTSKSVVNTGLVGGGLSHPTIPPYKAVYIYIKT